MGQHEILRIVGSQPFLGGHFQTGSGLHLLFDNVKGGKGVQRRDGPRSADSAPPHRHG